MAQGVVSETTIGQVPSFGLPTGFVRGPGLTALPPATFGSQAGVPAPDSMPTGNQSSAQSAQNYGLLKAGAGPTQQPLFWLFVVFVIGVFMIGHFAHFTLKGAR
ncbi:MAG: hypothetical protein C5B59_13690 [Bacteroidetes bacterium]|nr:MAG: hypothetical protein C5B59_13690 [Bacteroidota bacterium]